MYEQRITGRLLPESVKIELVGQEIKVKGKHGELEYAIPDEI